MKRLLVCSLALTLASCAPQAQRPDVQGDPVPHVHMPAGWHGDRSYQPVRSTWLEAYYREWRAELFRKGVVKWDERFDCNRFAGHLKASINVEYFVATFHARNVGQSAAVGEVWYTRDTGGRHAVLQVLTEQGWKYFEPQLGRWVVLSAAEERSVDKRDF